MTATAERLPDWLEAQRQTLMAQRGHAWLLQGPSGMGQFELGMALAKAWLCEQPTERGACGQCDSCHSIRVHAHADLCVLMPEVEMLARGWPLSEKAQSDIDDKKRKPSKEIRVDAMRDAVEFTQRTNARGRGKVVLVFPAEQMNAITANALLKTLEEPPGDVRFVLASEAAHQLLPTIRSRCLAHSMRWPAELQALEWLSSKGLAKDEAKAWLRLSGARPWDAWELSQSSMTLAQLERLPMAIAKGDASVFAQMSALQMLQWMQKLCYDLMCLLQGTEPKYFAVAHLPKPPPLPVLSRWHKSLADGLKTAEHPFNHGLMTEALAAQAHTVLNSKL